MTMPDVSGLPENLDATNPDDPANPSRKAHQQHHDTVHAAAKALLPRAEATATYAAKAGATYTGAHDFTGATVTGIAGGASSTVTLDADGTLVVDGLTVELATDAAAAAAQAQADAAAGTAEFATRGDVVYLYTGNGTTHSYVLAQGELDNGTSPRAYRGGPDGAPTSLAGHVAREGDWHLAVNP